MAGKPCGQTLRAEKNKKNTHRALHENMPDEIALKDEILALKRQVMMLKKTNERNLVKFRKYEDEAKRKDREIEELMDPRKNSEITKILSTKGAAILMNLRDQNESLIQMVLNKDLQIKRLIAEIKMSKLYASTRKRGHYAAEIIRLRGLVMDLQETLREKETGSVCLNGNAFIEMSSSSDQSSPRESEELRHTIQNLEACIKYSNELLTKKNKEISMLSDELSTLRESVRLYNEKKKRERFFDYKEREFLVERCKLFEKSTEATEELPRSAPASSSRWQVSFCGTENPPRGCEEKATEKKEFLVHEELEEVTPEKSHQGLPTSLFHNMATQEMLTTNESASARTEPEEMSRVKRKWKMALVKYRQSRVDMSTKEKVDKEKTVEELKDVDDEKVDEDTTDSNAEKPDEQTHRTEEEQKVKEVHEEPDVEKQDDDSVEEVQENSRGSSQSSGNETPAEDSDCDSECPAETNQAEEEQDSLDAKEEDEYTQSPGPRSPKDTSQPKSGTPSNSPRVSYSQILDSSFESESSFSGRQVQVEVQINAVSSPGSDRSSQNPIHGLNFGDALAATAEDDEDDDDDVVVR